MENSTQKNNFLNLGSIEIDSYSKMILVVRITRKSTIDSLLNAVTIRMIFNNHRDSKSFLNTFCTFLQLAKKHDLNHEQLLKLMMNFKYSPIGKFNIILNMNKEEFKEFALKHKVLEDFKFQAINVSPPNIIREKF